eukprot:TRINITY_DN55222_c0_g1_i1.p2 TRINITY_DN55222_c0_g1~~TRINITY_DN55222_c0_g1_i1.p2  ORF type:complete len:242 (+),score=69.13 TRINITY_DN55222_c0_g1_i1:84-728(+)
MLAGRCAAAAAAAAAGRGPAARSGARRLRWIAGAAPRCVPAVRRRWCASHAAGQQLGEADRERLIHIEGQQGAPPRAAPKTLGGPGIGSERGDLALVFQCTADLGSGRQCGTQAVKRFSRIAYEKGVVIIQCPGCSNKHVIADNLGWFLDGERNIEAQMAARGQPMERASCSPEQLSELLGRTDPATGVIRGEADCAEPEAVGPGALPVTPASA